MMHKIHLRFLGFIWLALFVGACTHVPVAHFEDAQPIPPQAHPAPITFMGLRADIPTGSETGQIGGGFFCLYPSAPMSRGMVDYLMDKDDLRHTFNQTMRGLGYDTAGDGALLFEEEIDDDLLRTEYRIRGRLLEMRMDACVKKADIMRAFSPAPFGTRGQLYLRIEWHVFDTIKRTTTYRSVTQGYAYHRLHNPEGRILLFNDAFAMAAHNLAADPHFAALIAHNIRPPAKADEDQLHRQARPRQFAPDENVRIAPAPLSTSILSGHISDTQKAIVMVQGGVGHGSGFFITEQGHILTNAHVVGDARRVRIVLQNGEHYPAEILRKHKARDVALLRLEMMPTHGKPHILPIRTQWPAISEQVYAIGAPLSRRFQDTVTHGIISAHRKNFTLANRQFDFLQADVRIHGGNSGGPLLDQYGNVVGMSVSGYVENLSETGLNLFIPIESALRTLDIDTAP